jgi:hypothetical protein
VPDIEARNWALGDRAKKGNCDVGTTVIQREFHAGHISYLTEYLEPTSHGGSGAFAGSRSGFYLTDSYYCWCDLGDFSKNCLELIQCVLIEFRNRSEAGHRL